MKCDFDLSSTEGKRLAIKAQTSKEGIALYKKIVNLQKKCSAKMISFLDDWYFFFGSWRGIDPGRRNCNKLSDWSRSDVCQSLLEEFKDIGDKYKKLYLELGEEDISINLIWDMYCVIKYNYFIKKFMPKDI